MKRVTVCELWVVGWVVCGVVAAVSAQLSLSRDTVYSIDVLGVADTVTMENIGRDTLTIDSITIERDTVQMPDCVIYVYLLPHRPDQYHYTYTLSPGWPPYDLRYHYDLVTLAPGQEVMWFDWYVSSYIPSYAKRTTRNVYTGETLGALLTFYAGSFVDSLVVMGLGECKSCIGVRSQSAHVRARTARLPRGPLVDLRGKRVSQEAGFRPKGVYVGRAAGRACLLVE